MLGLLIHEFGSGILRQESKGEASALESHDRPTDTHISGMIFDDNDLPYVHDRRCFLLGSKVWLLGRDLTERILHVAGSRATEILRPIRSS